MCGFCQPLATVTTGATPNACLLTCLKFDIATQPALQTGKPQNCRDCHFGFLRDISVFVGVEGDFYSSCVQYNILRLVTHDGYNIIYSVNV